MKKLSIAKLREIEVERLAAMYDGNIQAARKIMNSFYRLCGLCETNLYLANDERTCNRPSTKASAEREEKWVTRLCNALKPYGLTLYYSGYCPSIGVKYENGGCAERITRWFYD